MTQFSKQLSKITLLVLLGLVLAGPALALQLDYPEWFPIKTGMSLTGLVVAVFKLFLSVAGVTAFIMIAVGGFRYLTSAGNPSKMSDATSQIFNALLGLVLLLCSWLILNTINPELVKLKEPDLEKLGAAAFAPAGTISVRITDPVNKTETWNITDTGTKTIPLEEALKLRVNMDNKRAWLEGGIPAWPETPEEGKIEEGETISVRQDFTSNSKEIFVNFSIAMSKAAAAGKITLTFSIPGLVSYTHEVANLGELAGYDETFLAVLHLKVNPQTKTIELVVPNPLPGDNDWKIIEQTFEVGKTNSYKIDIADVPEFAQVLGLPKTLRGQITLTVPESKHAICLYTKSDCDPILPGVCPYDLLPGTTNNNLGDNYPSLKVLKSGYAIRFFSEDDYGEGKDEWGTICFKDPSSCKNLEDYEIECGGAHNTWEDDTESLMVISPSACSEDEEKTVCHQAP